MSSSVLLTTAKISLLEATSPSEKTGQPNFLSSCALKWKSSTLWVSPIESSKQSHPPALGNEQWLRSCLRCSPVRKVCLDPRLREEKLRLWANLCSQSNKQVFLRLPSARELPQKRRSQSWWVKCAIERIAAGLLLVVLGPILLGLIGAKLVFSPGTVFSQQWQVGQRGKLFRIIKFRVDDPHMTPLSRWLCKYKLDKLPQLINVLCGEMSLVGPRPVALYDAAQICPSLQQRLNALPGIFSKLVPPTGFPTAIDGDF